MSPGRATSKAGGRSASANDQTKGSGRSLRRTAGRDVAGDPKTGKPQRNFPPGQLRKEVETCGLCHARRGEFSEDWVPGRWLSDTHVSPCSRAGFITPTARCATRSTITARSSRARCLRPASPAAIAMSRTARNCAPPATVSACNATRPTNIRGAPITTRRRIRRSPAPPAICRRAPIWWSTAARSQLPRSAARSVGEARDPNACNDCHADKSPNGRRRPSRVAWTEPERLPEICRGIPCGVDRRRRGRRYSPPSLPTRYAGVRACERADRARTFVSPATSTWRGQRALGSRSDGADRRARHA